MKGLGTSPVVEESGKFGPAVCYVQLVKRSHTHYLTNLTPFGTDSYYGMGLSHTWNWNGTGRALFNRSHIRLTAAGSRMLQAPAAAWNGGPLHERRWWTGRAVRRWWTGRAILHAAHNVTPLTA